MALTSNFTDASATATVHAAHHDDMATALNALYPFPLPRQSGRYYDAGLIPYTASTTALAANTQIFMPFAVTNPITIDRAAMEVATSGGSTVAFGVYADTGNVAPGALVSDFGTINTTSTGFKENTISQALNGASLYWLSCIGPGGGTLRSHPNTAMPIIGNTLNTVGELPTTYYRATVTYTGAMPATAGTLTFSSTLQVPTIRVRIA